MCVVRSAVMDQRLVPGGGALEMALAQELNQKAKSAVSGVQKVAYLAVAQALEVIPRTLAQNCGANVLKQITELRAYHAIDPAKNWTMGINGETGQLVDMKELGVWDPVSVKSQTFKTAIEVTLIVPVLIIWFRPQFCCWELTISCQEPKKLLMRTQSLERPNFHRPSSFNVGISKKVLHFTRSNDHVIPFYMWVGVWVCGSWRLNHLFTCAFSSRLCVILHGSVPQRIEWFILVEAKAVFYKK